MAAANDGDVAVVGGGRAKPPPPCTKVRPPLHFQVEGVALQGLRCHFFGEGEFADGSDVLARAH
ncbi:hypothetical protein BIWAKO_01047 [Bosea sp. BIWAKO-01]|nr:hypothetical protein BIWAKO_01047 [Bosea sp. BIWAKO-01]